MYKKSLVLVWNNYRSDVQLLERFASGTRLSNWEIPWNHPYITALWYWGFQREPQFGPIMWRSTSLSGSTVIFFQSENISPIILLFTAESQFRAANITVLNWDFMMPRSIVNESQFRTKNRNNSYKLKVHGVDKL